MHATTGRLITADVSFFPSFSSTTQVVLPIAERTQNAESAVTVSPKLGP